MALTFLKSLHDLITRWTAYVGAGCCCVSAPLFSYDVALRYFFNSPTEWAGDISSYLLCVGVFLVLPLITRERSHVAITFFVDAMPQRPAGRIKRGLSLLSGLVCLLAAYFSGVENIRQVAMGILTAASTQLPKWWISIFISYGFASAGLYFLRDSLQREAARP